MSDLFARSHRRLSALTVEHVLVSPQHMTPERAAALLRDLPDIHDKAVRA